MSSRAENNTTRALPSGDGSTGRPGQTTHAHPGVLTSVCNYVTYMLTRATDTAVLAHSDTAQDEAVALAGSIDQLDLQSEQVSATGSPRTGNMAADRRTIDQYVQKLEKRIRHQDRDLELLEKYKEREPLVTQLGKDYDGLASKYNKLGAVNQKLHAEVEHLKEQVVQYKGTISSSTHLEEQTADNVIEGEATQIFFAIQGFAAKNFRSVKFDYEKLPAPTTTWVKRFTSTTQDPSSYSAVKIVISIISTRLAVAFAPNVSFGVSNNDVVKAANMLAGLDSEALPDMRSWIETTRKLIAGYDGNLLAEAQNAQIRDMAFAVYHDLEHAMPVQWTHNMEQDLYKIFASGLKLFSLLRSQSARFKVFMVCATHEDGRPYAFDPVEMEDINGEDEEELRDRVVAISLFPFIVKLGDEHGENPNAKSVVSKARVVVEDRARSVYSGMCTRSSLAASVHGVHGGTKRAADDVYEPSDDSSLV